jgi:hypothetical protein
MKFNLKKNIINKAIYSDKRTMKFWTSGANDGAQCDAQGVYAWCALSELVPTGLLTAHTKAANSSSERCLLLDAASADNSSLLAHSDCSQKMAYICESQCTAVSACPSNCKKNVSKAILNKSQIIYFDLKRRRSSTPKEK